MFYFFENPLAACNFSFFTFTFYFTFNSRQNKALPLKIPQIFVRCLGNSKAIKNQDPWKFHIIFLVTLGNSTLLHCLLLFHLLLFESSKFIHIASYVASYICTNIMKWNEVKLYFFQHNKCTFYILQLLKNIC